MASLVSHLSHLSALMPYIEAVYTREKADPDYKPNELEKFCIKEFSKESASMMYSHIVEVVNLIPDENRAEFNAQCVLDVAHMKEGEKIYAELQESLAVLNVPPEIIGMLRKIISAKNDARG